MAKRLNELVTGDKVAYADNWTTVGIGWGSTYLLWEEAVVEKHTNHELTVNGQRFLRRNGIRVGNQGARHPTRIRPWSEEIEKEIEETRLAITERDRRRAALAIIESVTMRNLPVAKLEAIAEILQREE